MNKMQITDKVVYADLRPTPEEEAAQVVYKTQGDLTKPEMVNRAIEDPEVRSKIPPEEGNICVSIQPGDELGQLSFNVQFEGRRGDYDFCLNEHNTLLLHVAEWVKDLFGELDADFDVTIESKPCPKTEQRIAIDVASRLLEGHLHLVKALEGISSHVESKVNDNVTVPVHVGVKF